MEPGETPPLYKGIVLHLLGDLGLRPFCVLSNRSRSSFIKYVESFGAGVGLIPLKDFDPNKLPTVSSPEEVELHDGAEFVVIIPPTTNKLDQRIESLEGWQANQTAGYERQLVPVAMNYLVELGHDKETIEPLCDRKIYAANGDYREIDGAKAGNCVVVVDYKNKLDKAAAYQLAGAVDFIKLHNTYEGKQIYGLLAGHVQTTDPKNRAEMDDILRAAGLEKRFVQAFYGPDPCRPFPTSGTYCADPNGPDSSSPGNGTATLAAMPRRVGMQVAIPMRRALFQVQPRPRKMISKFTGLKLSSLI